MGRSLGFIAAGIGLAVVLTGCGAGPSNTAAPSSAPAAPASSATAAPAPVSAATWMDGFCGSLIGLSGMSTMQMPQVAPGDVAAAKTAVVDVFTKAESAVESAVEGLGKLPAAPVAAGDTAKTTLLAVFTPILQKIKDAKAKLVAAPDGDTQSLLDASTALTAIGTDASKIENPLKEMDASPELAAAGKTAPNCQKLPQ
jgi:hypothetical protein